MLPERDNAGARAVPPFEQLILVAWHEPREMAWMRERGRVVVRLGSRPQSLALLRALSAATHILLRSRDDKTQPGLWRIEESGGQLLTRVELVREGYFPAGGGADLFAAFAAAPDAVYAGWQWDGQALHAAIEAFERRSKPRLAAARRAVDAPCMLSLGDALTAAR
jgi:hypothetical protein